MGDIRPLLVAARWQHGISEAVHFSLNVRADWSALVFAVTRNLILRNTERLNCRAVQIDMSFDVTLAASDGVMFACHALHLSRASAENA